MRNQIFYICGLMLVIISACSSLPHRHISEAIPLVHETSGMQYYSSTSEIFANYHGLRGHDKFVYFTGGKYYIYLGSYDLAPTAKNKSRIKSRIAREVALDRSYSISGLNIERYFKSATTDSITYHQSVYLIGLEGRTDVIGFTSYFPEDVMAELAFVQSYINEGLYEEALTPNQINSLNFIGREIKFPITCSWSGPSNLRCGPNGQMSWSVHASYKEALYARNVKTYENAVLKKQVPLISDTISVYFEGEAVEAIKRVYGFGTLRQAMGVPPSIVVYYVAAPVRGQFAAVTMSHFIDEAPEGQLPAFLSEVMELGDDEISSLSDIPDPSLLYPTRAIEFKTGMWIPFGNLSKTMYPSPFLAIQYNALPLLSANFRFMHNKKTASFGYMSESEGQINVTSNTIVSLDLRASFPKHVSNNYILNRYIGVGISFLNTNEKDPSKAGKKKSSNPHGGSSGSEYYSIETVGLALGSSFIRRIHRKSMIGIFAEYNFSPFGLSKQISNSFGSHAFSIGLNFNF